MLLFLNDRQNKIKITYKSHKFHFSKTHLFGFRALDLSSQIGTLHIEMFTVYASCHHLLRLYILRFVSLRIRFSLYICIKCFIVVLLH